MSLIMINEGRKQVYEFFVRNGVKPAQVVFDLECFEEVEPFITSEDIIAIVVHGFTNFHKAGILQLLEKMAENDNIEYDNIIILSDMDLKGIGHEYYLYDGNPFKSPIKLVRGNTVIDEETVRNKAKTTLEKQGVMDKLRLYSSDSKCLVFEQTENRKKGILNKNEADDTLYKHIKVVDLFKKLKK